MIGCTKSSPEKELYLEMIEELNDEVVSSNNIPFDIDISYEELSDEEIIYRVIIDNPKEEIKDMKVLAVHNKETDDIFPSVGIFDEPINMKPGTVNDNYVKGIVLTGYIDYDDSDNFNVEFKVLVKYLGEEVYYIK